MKQYNNKKKMMIMVLCVAIVLAGNMQGICHGYGR